MSRVNYSTREIQSLHELQPGDHIHVRGGLGEFVDAHLPQLELYTHHMLVEKVVDDSHINIIHKTIDRGVLEEIREYQPEQITVLDYECLYTGKEIIQRARHQIDPNQYYSLLWNNCEHFAFKMRRGFEESHQVQNVVFGVRQWGLHWGLVPQLL